MPDVMRWKCGQLLSNLGNVIQAACEPDGDARSFYARDVGSEIARKAEEPPDVDGPSFVRLRDLRG